MKIYNRLVGELGAGDPKYIQQLSEVELSDPEDIKVTANDPGGTMVVHLGASDFLPRYKLYVAHIGEWRQQFPNLQSVDLRYEGQVVVNPDKQQDPAVGRSGDPTPARARAARTAVPDRAKAARSGSPGDRVIGKAATAKSGAPVIKPVSHSVAQSKKHSPQRTERAQ